MRRFVAGLLIVISAVTLLLSSTSLWTRRNVINTQVFVSNVDTMLALPQVQARINGQVTSTVMANPQVQGVIDDVVGVLPPRLQQLRPTVQDGVQSVVSAGVQRVLSNRPFKPLTTAAITSAHDQLVNGQPVQFTLGQAKNLVPPSAQTGLAGQVLALVPNDLGVTLVTPAEAPQLYSSIDLLKSAWLWAGLVAAATLAGALGVSRHRRGTLRAWAVTATVLLLLQLLALRVARGSVVAAAKQENRDAVGAIYDVLAASLRSWTLWLIAVTLLVFVLTLVWGHLGLVASVRRAARSARETVRRRREEHRAAQAAAVAATGNEAAAAEVPEEPWTRRVAAATRAFVDGLQLPERTAWLGGIVRDHLDQARWTGIVIGALVLLFWPAPTLTVLIWIAAFVALYLGALQWLQARAPERPAPGEEPTAEPVPAEPGALTPEPPPRTPPVSSDAAAAVSPAEPSAAAAPADHAAARTVPDGALVASRPGEAPSAAPIPVPRPAPQPLTPEVISTLNDRLDLLVRLGAARDAGVLTEEEFRQEKFRLLAV